MPSLEFRAMNCQMLAVVEPSGDQSETAARLAALPARFGEWEQCLSRFRPDSELSRLNREAGQALPVSDTLLDVVRSALWAAEESGGLVVPTLLGALEAAGYDRSFEALGDTPASPAPSEPEAQLDWQAIEIEAEARTIRLPAGLRLDLGGVAKGWAADQAVELLGQAGPALVDAGGDISMSAPPSGQPGWSIGVANPLQPGEHLEMLCVAQGGVATSGRDYRRWQHLGAWQHHILDPRTGRPAKTDVLSATVIAPTTQEAEMAAKTAFILGSRAGLAWLEERPTLAGLLVLEGGAAIHSRRLLDYVWR